MSTEIRSGLVGAIFSTRRFLLALGQSEAVLYIVIRYLLPQYLKNPLSEFQLCE
jgi:hypothetical protein